MVELTIRADDHGQITVSGPIDNKALAYGLLAVAQDVVRDFHQQQAQKMARVQLAQPVLTTAPPTVRKIF